MTRRPSAAAQRRAVKRQAAIAAAPDSGTRWLCGSCGDVLAVQCVYEDSPTTWIGHGPWSARYASSVVAHAVACPESACDARLVRCVRCGGEKAARAALKAHACRVAT